MQCYRCARPMTPLFISFVCDFCDGLAADDTDYDHGWVVWRGRAMPADEYVFSTPEEAERWREVQGLEDCPIREVLAPIKFRWRKSNGSVKGLRMAERPVTIYPDRRFPIAPNRAFLADAA
jgi:hypothetical protein